MTQHLAEENRYFFLPYIVPEEHAIQTKTPACRTDRQARDDGDPVFGKPMTHTRGLANRYPRSAHTGGKQESRFVDKNQVGAQPSGVFFILFQLLVFHSWIAALLRSRARCSGFCGLHPKACMSRPTWV